MAAKSKAKAKAKARAGGKAKAKAKAKSKTSGSSKAKAKPVVKKGSLKASRGSSKAKAKPLVKKEDVEETPTVKRENLNHKEKLLSERGGHKFTRRVSELLPDDAPEGHVAHSKIRDDEDHQGLPRTNFRGKFPNVDIAGFQISHRKVGFNLEAAHRIARICYMRAEAGGTQEEIQQLREDCFTVLKGPEGAQNRWRQGWRPQGKKWAAREELEAGLSATTERTEMAVAERYPALEKFNEARCRIDEWKEHSGRILREERAAARAAEEEELAVARLAEQEERMAARDEKKHQKIEAQEARRLERQAMWEQREEARQRALVERLQVREDKSRIREALRLRDEESKITISKSLPFRRQSELTMDRAVRNQQDLTAEVADYPDNFNVSKNLTQKSRTPRRLSLREMALRMMTKEPERVKYD